MKQGNRFAKWLHASRGRILNLKFWIFKIIWIEFWIRGKNVNIIVRFWKTHVIKCFLNSQDSIFINMIFTIFSYIFAAQYCRIGTRNSVRSNNLSWKISKSYIIRFQRYEDKKIWVCVAKNQAHLSFLFITLEPCTGCHWKTVVLKSNFIDRLYFE